MLLQISGGAVGLILMAGIPILLIKLVAQRRIIKNNLILVWIVFVILMGSLLAKGHAYNRNNKNNIYEQPSRLNLTKTKEKPEANEYIEERADGTLYRNINYKFRLIFPKDWEVSEGDGEHVIKKAEWNHIASINVLAREGPDNVNSNEIDDQELIEFGKASVKPVIERGYGELLETKILHINNQKSIRITLRITYKKLDGNYIAINNQYTILKNGYLYAITTSCLESECAKVQKQLFDSVNSFVIEDY